VSIGEEALMTCKPKLLIQGLLVGTCLVTEGSASASLVSYTIANSYVGTGSGGTTSGYADLETFNVSIDGTPLNGAFAGGIEISEAGAPVPGLPSEYTTVCTDISGSLYLGQTYAYAAPVSSFNGTLSGVKPTWGADNSSGLTDQVSANKAIQNAAYLFYNYSGGLTKFGLGGSADQMAALQLAVWEVLYDTTAAGQVVLGSNARFQVSSTGPVVTAADSLVASLNGSYAFPGYLLFPDPVLGGVNSNSDGEPPQELLIGVPGVVPEPSTILAGAMALLPFGANALRVLRKRS
jgi:hypothetical protein